MSHLLHCGDTRCRAVDWQENFHGRRMVRALDIQGRRKPRVGDLGFQAANGDVNEDRPQHESDDNTGDAENQGARSWRTP